MHGDFKRLFLAQLYGELLQTPVNTSVTRILTRPDGCRLEDYNQMDHLPADLVTS